LLSPVDRWPAPSGATSPSAWIKSTVGIIRRRVRLLQATCTDVRMSSTEEDAGASSQRSAAPGPQPVREKDGPENAAATGFVVASNLS
jgi:hypothetical protein